MSNAFTRFFAPEPEAPRLPEAEINRKYPKLRWRVLEATFVGYALYYLVRNNLPVVSKDLQTHIGYTKEMIGALSGVTAISYGLGKFFMGAISDRSNPRVFIAVGLMLTSLLNFAFAGTTNYEVHLLLFGLNGLAQGMGWPPCGRSMGHWFSERERGFTFSIWNTSHNFGGAIAGWLSAASVAFVVQSMDISPENAWRAAFYVPAVITFIMSFYLLFRLVDTPQSQGLPPIEEYKNDFTDEQRQKGLPEREFTYKELFFDNVLLNKFVWILAIANFFAYISRYSMVDWGPTYMREVKHQDISGSSWAIVAIELGGIPSTIFLGYLSDKLGGRRGMVAVLCMIPIIAAFALIPYVPEKILWMDLVLLFIIGLMIYPVINFITIMALDMTSKKAIGVAAGFIGLFGYMGKAVYSWGAGRALDTLIPKIGKEAAWNVPLHVAMGASILAMLLLALTWNQKPKA